MLEPKDLDNLLDGFDSAEICRHHKTSLEVKKIIGGLQPRPAGRRASLWLLSVCLTVWWHISAGELKQFTTFNLHPLELPKFLLPEPPPPEA